MTEFLDGFIKCKGGRTVQLSDSPFVLRGISRIVASSIARC